MDACWEANGARHGKPLPGLASPLGSAFASILFANFGSALATAMARAGARS